MAKPLFDKESLRIYSDSILVWGVQYHNHKETMAYSLLTAEVALFSFLMFSNLYVVHVEKWVTIFGGLLISVFLYAAILIQLRNKKIASYMVEFAFFIVENFIVVGESGRQSAIDVPPPATSNEGRFRRCLTILCGAISQAEAERYRRIHPRLRRFASCVRITKSDTSNTPPHLLVRFTHDMVLCLFAFAIPSVLALKLMLAFQDRSGFDLAEPNVAPPTVVRVTLPAPLQISSIPTPLSPVTKQQGEPPLPSVSEVHRR